MGATKRQKVLIVGGGPAGCATGAALAQRGCDVEVIDLRGDPRKQNGTGINQQRSINLALSTRGLTTLDAIGCGDRAREIGVPMQGRALHGLNGNVEFQPYGQPGQHLLSVPRAELTLLVQEAAERTGCTISFDEKCVDVDVAAPSVRVQSNASEEVVEKHADLLVGADGTFSKVRAAMMRKEEFDYSQDYLPAAYKELSMPAETARDMRREALHIWPRGKFMLIALPNLDGSFTCTLFHDRKAFDAIRTDHDVNELFVHYFPDALDRIPSLAKQFFANPTPGLLTVKCRPYHYADKAFLVGDAAHAIVPFYGQGCNLALEDVRILWETWDELQGDLAEVLPSFSERRKANADTIAQLAVENYEEMASKTASTLFRLRKKVGLLLNRIAPETYMPLYTMISFSNIPYREAVDRAARTERSVSRISTAGAVVALLATVSVALPAAASAYSKIIRLTKGDVSR